MKTVRPQQAKRAPPSPLRACARYLREVASARRRSQGGAIEHASHEVVLTVLITDVQARRRKLGNFSSAESFGTRSTAQKRCLARAQFAEQIVLRSHGAEAGGLVSHL